MKNINVIYDYEYDEENDAMDIVDDVDIISVPDYVCENLDKVVQKFFDWAYGTKDHGYWQYDKERGCDVLAIGTEQFIKWINDNYFNCENKEAVIIDQHTKYNPDYPCAEF